MLVVRADMGIVNSLEIALIETHGRQSVLLKKEQSLVDDIHANHKLVFLHKDGDTAYFAA